MCVLVLQAGEYTPHMLLPYCRPGRTTSSIHLAVYYPPRNGGHVNPPLFHDYLQLKSEFGVESAKRIIRFRRAHHSSLREAIEDIGALDHSQIRDVEHLDVHFEHDTFEEQVKRLEAWRKDMPEESEGCRAIEGNEAAKVTLPATSFSVILTRHNNKWSELDVPTF